jgi:hypothetical protein
LPLTQLLVISALSSSFSPFLGGDQPPNYVFTKSPRRRTILERCA